MHNFNPRIRFFEFIRDLQETVCKSLEEIEGSESFIEDSWDRPEGGGGWSRIFSGGAVLEKAGVNVSEVHGPIPDILKDQVPSAAKSFYATGISIVIHPRNPMAPTTHANFRYFQVLDSNDDILDQWFGGGADLTPYYLFEEDASHFHRTLKTTCDEHNQDFYPKFKVWCDKYFYNTHRQEQRGIGGIFFDHLRPGEELQETELENFIYKIASAFLPAYIPIIKQRMNLNYSSAQKHWQEVRRGRYVEFNLLHDRGKIFGLKTGGRIESIYMSLPPIVRWEYNVSPKKNTAEWNTLEILKKPKNWL